jgi:hypothetical protein
VIVEQVLGLRRRMEALEARVRAREAALPAAAPPAPPGRLE